MKLSRGVVLFVVICVISVAGLRPCSEKCKTIPPLSTCNADTGTCSQGCVPGYYGNTCNLTCDVHCEQGTCQQRHGLCMCKPGYKFNEGFCDSHKGVTCESNDHCVNNTCVSARRLNCLEGCKPGWFGEFCQRSCSPHCNCDEATGICSTCIQGWYGDDCGSRCSPGCVNKNCQRNGTCVKSCTKGSYGDTCNQKCSQHCVSGCDQLSGDCVRCEAGRFGQTCQFRCSARCAGANSDCDRDGICVNGCIQGYFGEKCESKCPRQCVVDSCDINGTCSACNNGFFGTLCNQLCPKCKDDICNQTTGECIKGCESGFYGSFCNLMCVDCKDEPCPKCKDDFCHQMTGECIKGCESGFYGSFCNLTCEACTGGDCDRVTGECRHKEKLPFIIGGGAIFLVFVLAGLTACCLKRMRDIVKDGVNTIGQNTAVQSVPGHGAQLRSIELGDTDTNASGTNPDDTYNHLCAFQPPEATFTLANDDLETASGYCAVLPLFSGLSCQHLDESVDGSGGGSDGGSDTGRSMISLFEEEGSEIRHAEATVVAEKVSFPKPIQIVALRPDRKKYTPETIQIVNIRPDREKHGPNPIQTVVIHPDNEERTQEPIQIVNLSPDEKGACFGLTIEDEDETTGCGEADDQCSGPGVGEQEREGDDPSAANNSLDTVEIVSVSDEINSVIEGTEEYP